ncbi:ATP-dependent zinc metalloprotease FtsH 2 [Bienertia sinuspersici]
MLVRMKDGNGLSKKRERRIWSAEEETILADILYEINGSGWKVDTGYKSGYLTYIEKEMRKRLQNCDLQADSHIKAKVKILKKQLTYILEIQQNESVFGWDNKLKMVTGDKDIFMEWAKLKYANDLAKRSKVKGAREQYDMDEDQCDTNVVQPDNQAADEAPQL